MNKFNIINTLIIYLRHISFIGFVFSAIIIYPSLKTEKFGILCFSLILIYLIINTIMFFVKSRKELNNLLNNLVVCILHFYMLLIAYKYVYSIDIQLANPSFFSFSYLIASISMFVLIINKFILISSKN